MTIIFVDKEWLHTIGEIRNLLIFSDYTPTHIALLAESAKNTFPFVEAEIATFGDNERPFRPVYIPHSLISAMFDVTAEQAQALGIGGKAG
jgi:hypothetical protein